MAQHIRFLLAYTGTEYNDFQYTSKEQYRTEKESLGLEFPNVSFYEFISVLLLFAAQTSSIIIVSDLSIIIAGIGVLNISLFTVANV